MGISMLRRECRALAWLCASVVLASSPAWLGSWIYDDWHMRGNELLDGLDDVLHVFQRTSADYLKSRPDQAITGVTYRPLSMLSVIVVQSLWRDSPLAHHLLSVVLHLMCVVGIFLALTQRTRREIAVTTSTLFALHPAGIEAYGWINGRSDVLAGACLAWLAFAVRVQASRRRYVSCFFLAMAATLAKETAFLTVFGLLVAEALPAQSESFFSSVKRALPTASAGAAGALAAILMRALAVGTSSSGAEALFLRYEDEPFTRVMRLWSVALETIIVAAPRTMKSLAFELSHSLTTIDVLLLGLSSVALLAAAWGRRLRTVWLVLVAALSLVPTLVVSHGFWHGLDRYLYMPGLLLLLAIAESIRHDAQPLVRQSLARTVRIVLSLGLAVSTFLTATSYASQGAHLNAMIATRPQDPTGYLAGALWLWEAKKQDEARELVNKMPRDDLPPALMSQLVTVLSHTGRPQEALEVLADMERRYPRDPFVLYDVFAVSLERGDFERAFAAERKLEELGMFCGGRRALVESVATKHPEWADTIGKARSMLTCN